MNRPSRLAAAVAAGVILGVLLTATPLMLLVVLLGAAVVAGVRYDLPADERRAVTAIVAAALAARVIVVFALAVAGAPLTSDQSPGLVFGDEGYVFERAMRTRNVLLGLPATKLDYLTTTEPYTQTRFTTWMAWTQVAFGPSPAGTRLLNGVLFVAAGALLYRVARRGFGAVAALAGLGAVLFLPTSLFWSVSLLKESMFFLLTAGALSAATWAVRASSIAGRVAAAIGCVLSVWLVSDLRMGALAVTAGGLLFGALLWWTTASRRRAGAAAAVAIVAAVAAVAWTPSSSRLVGGVTLAAQQHAGHVGTVGHAYKTLDERFYPSFGTVIARQPMTLPEALRFLGRSAVAFITVPLPWQATGPFELLYMPEQVAWYLIVGLAVGGLATAWRLDRLFASLLVGYVVPMAALLAAINGNVGTLVRLRELVVRFMVWIAAVGLVVLVQHLMARDGERALAP
jgi:hypothetical protein